MMAPACLQGLRRYDVFLDAAIFPVSRMIYDDTISLSPLQAFHDGRALGARFETHELMPLLFINTADYIKN